jgi:hypothetical protein
MDQEKWSGPKKNNPPGCEEWRTKNLSKSEGWKGEMNERIMAII